MNKLESGRSFLSNGKPLSSEQRKLPCFIPKKKKKSRMHLVIISLGFGQATWKKYEKKTSGEK